jgi:glutamate dehydrogenase (NAD(P)+)
VCAGVANDDTFLDLPADVLVPCSVDGTISQANVARCMHFKVGWLIDWL